MSDFLSRYTRFLWITLSLLVIGIISLLVYLFVLPRPSAPSSPLPSTVVSNIRTIYRDGLSQGNNANVFSKVGDSITVASNFLTPIAEDAHTLGSYTQLGGVIEQYQDAQLRTGNSFSNQSLAAGNGWSSATVLDPNYAKEDACVYPETPLQCEYRYSKPSVALIMLGSNDVQYRNVNDYVADMQQIIDISVEAGVIPVISTIPYQPEFAGQVATYNEAIRELATQNQVPLWEYADATSDIPNYGLSADNLHPNAPPWDQFSGSVQFTPDALQYGFTVRNLTALQMLAAVQQSLPG